MPKIKLNSKKSLFEPIEVELDGEVFKIEKVDRSLFKKTDPFESKKGDSLSKQVDDVYKQLSVILEVPMERVEKYDYRDAQYVLNQIAREVFFAPTKRKEETEGKIPKNPKN